MNSVKQSSLNAPTTPAPSQRRWILAILIGGLGVAWHFTALSLIERLVTSFPSVPDVLMDRWPRVDFGLFGEVWFFGLIALFAVAHFRADWRKTPDVLIALGLMYFVRGWFLFLFPIGAPGGAVGPAERFSVWGHEAHAYFFGGHIAILTVLAMFAPSRLVRRLLWTGLVVFGIGTMLSKNHYTMDSVAGILIGYAIAVWVQRQFRYS